MISGYQKMNVEFKRLAEKHRNACQYDVRVEGITIGTLCKDYEEGWVISPGCIGGTCKGHWAWYFEPVESLDEALCLSNNWERLWLIPSDGLWMKQKQAFAAFKKGMDAPLKTVNEYDAPRVTIFLKWLRSEAKTYYVNTPQPRKAPIRRCE